MRIKSAVFLLLFIAMSIFIAANSRANPGIIPVAKFATGAMPGGIPEGWSLEKKTGYPIMNMEKDGSVFYLHLISQGDSSFGVRKEARVDIKKFPILCWRWKVVKLPKGGDVRKSSVDDQALQVYIAFKESGFLGMNTPIVGYVWDNEAPKGWSGRSPQTGGDKVRCMVLRNKTDKIGQWYTERRNVYQDYKRLFADIDGGEPQSATTGLQIYINSQRTKSPADSMIGDIYFSNDPSDIALAESGKEAPPEKVAIISAVKPPVIAKKRPAKILPLPDCINIKIEFATASTTIADKYKDDLQTVADYLIKYKDIKINIVGRTDNVGREEYNLELSNRRAESVKNYLVEQLNIDPERINAQGVGSSNPIAGNDTPDGRRQNRSVLINDCPDY
jgi:outer membrane protein OmpA-like peptidoglycan-associated protein